VEPDRQKLLEKNLDLPCFTCGAASNKPETLASVILQMIHNPFFWDIYIYTCNHHRCLRSIAAVVEERRRKKEEEEA